VSGETGVREGAGFFYGSAMIFRLPACPLTVIPAQAGIQ